MEELYNWMVILNVTIRISAVELRRRKEPVCKTERTASSVT